VANEIRSTSGIAVATPSGFVRSTYGLGERNRSASIRSTSGVGSMGAQAGLRATSGQGFFLSPAGSPTVAATAAQLEVPSGALVLLRASAVPTSPATIVSYAWRVVSRSVGAPLVTLPDTTSQNPTFNAPPAIAEYTVTLGVTVHDSVGRVSPEATVTVTVRRANRIKATSGGWTLPVARAKATAAGWS
jgi:hypothetical protein